MNGDHKVLYEKMEEVRIITARLDENIKNVNRNFESHLKGCANRHRCINQDIDWLKGRVFMAIGAVGIITTIVGLRMIGVL